MYPHTKRNSAACEEMYWEKPKFHDGKIALFIKVYRERHSPQRQEGVLYGLDLKKPDMSRLASRRILAYLTFLLFYC
ncbi:hypothetical protein MTR_2g437550 [Medicago truncatula]|uniref:Uncharacterized protein n=1 Tax=Medicago truncatula TaxID=3880 RepID=A0A072V7L3_MEDTR|nr:hypothetical protein MTR_2g437550 [Medicago truncatula]